MAKQTEQDRNREAWLTDAIAMITPLIKQRTGLHPLKPIKASVGFASRGGRKSKSGRVTTGQCCMTEHNKYHQLFIHPMFDDDSVIDMLGTLAHEVLHGSLPMHVGHRKDFSQAAKKLGLEGKPTSTTVGEELTQRLREIRDSLGVYPNESYESIGGTQTTRLLKCECPMCGYVVRVTRKWIDEAGEPICPQDLVAMQEGGVSEEVDNPLVPVHQTVEYRVKLEAATKKIYKDAKLPVPRFDERWAIRMNRVEGEMSWWIVDYGESFKIVDGHRIRILDAPLPRLTPAENREDAIALMEALRDGTMTYDEVKYDDDDPALDEDPDAEYEDEETEDFPDDSDPRFKWEIDKGIEFDPEAEAAKREAA